MGNNGTFAIFRYSSNLSSFVEKVLRCSSNKRAHNYAQNSERAAVGHSEQLSRLQLLTPGTAEEHAICGHNNIHRLVIWTHWHCIHHLCPVRQRHCRHITQDSQCYTAATRLWAPFLWQFWGLCHWSCVPSVGLLLAFDRVSASPK